MTTYNIDNTNEVVNIENSSSADEISFASLENLGFSNLKFAKADNNLEITYEGINDGEGKVVVAGYFAQAEANRLTTFNVKGTEYTLEWHYSNTKQDWAMYNVTHNPDGKTVEGIRNWVNGWTTEDVNITGKSAGDMLAGSLGNDTITASAGASELYGDAGNDILNGGASDDYIQGDGNDVAIGGNDKLYGNGGNDKLISDAGDDEMYGGEGNDHFFINGAGNKTVTGGEGNDTFNIIDTNAVVTIKDGSFADKISFAYLNSIGFNNLDFAKAENEKDLVITYKNIAGAMGKVVVEGYFDQAEADRLTTFNVKGTEYTLGWHDGAMYNEIRNTDDKIITAVSGIQNWIDGQSRDEFGKTIAGGDKYDMLAGTQNSDTITAGANGAEIYGDGGADTITATNSFIVGGSGADTINVSGGNNTIMFLNTPSLNPTENDSYATGTDTVNGATSGDVLKFAYTDKSVGYSVADLSFAKNGDNLEITAKKDATHENTVILTDFFKSTDNVDTLWTTDGEKSIKADAVINVVLQTNENFVADENYTYNLTLAEGATGVTITGLKETDTLNIDGELSYTYHDVLGVVISNETKSVTINDFWVPNSHYGDYEQKEFILKNGDNVVDFEKETLVVDYSNAEESAKFSGLWRPGFGTYDITGSDYADKLTAGRDTNIIKGGDGDDEINAIGDNNTLTGGNGKDTFDVLYGSKATITDAEEGDSIALGLWGTWDDVTANKNAFVKSGNDLIINGPKDGDKESKVIVENFFSNASKVDTVKTFDSLESGDYTEHSIKNEVIFNVVLDSEHPTFDKVTSGYGDYKVAVSGTGSVSNLGANDKIATSGQTVKYMRENDGGLIVWSSNGDLKTDKITVTDFIFDGGHDINVNNGTTEGMTLNVTLTGNFAYTVSAYADTITGDGSVSGATESTIVYMGDHVDDAATCVGNDMTFTYYNDDEATDAHTITVKGFFNANGDITFKGNCYIDGDKKQYESLAYSDLNVEISGRTKFSNVFTYKGEQYDLFHTVNITGTDGDDTYAGGENADIFSTGAGTDVITAGDGADTININGTGDKTVAGGEGNDAFNITDTNAVVTITDASVDDTISFAALNNIGFNNLDFVKDENNLEISYKNILGANGKVVLEGYFTQTEASRLTTFNVGGTEYTLKWLVGNHGGAMYNFTNDPDGLVDGIQNWIQGADPVNPDEGIGVAIVGRDKYDMLSGTDYNDMIWASDAGAEIYATKGDDDIYGGKGDDFISAGVGNDNIHIDGAHAGGSDIICIADKSWDEARVIGTDTIYGATADTTLKFSLGDGLVGYKFSELKFNRVGNNLEIIAGDVETNKVIVDGFFTAESKVDKVQAFNDNNEQQYYSILNHADIYVDLTQVDGAYQATDYREVFYGTGTVNGFDNAKDSVESSSPRLARSNNSADLIVDSVIIKNFDFTTAFNILDGDFLIPSTDYPINVYLTLNTEYQATVYKEIISGLGSVNLGGDHPFDLSRDAVYVSDVDGVAYTRENNGDLHVVKGATDITVKGFSFAGGTDFNVTDGTTTILTAGQTIDVTLTGSDYISASGYAERITTTANSSVRFYPEDQYTGKDTLVFDADSDLSYFRDGNDLVIANGDLEAAGAILTTVKGYYTSGDMSVGGQFQKVGIKVGNLMPIELANVEKVEDISGVSYFDSGVWDTDRDETVEMIKGLTTDAAIDPTKLAADTEGTVTVGTGTHEGKYVFTSNAGHGTHELDSYALGRAGDDTIIGTDGTDWIHGGAGDDIILGGSGGHDMLAGGDGQNNIIAADIVNGHEVVFNKDGVEIYGGKDSDVIHAGGVDTTENYIWAHGGDDIIYLEGGKNTIMLVEDDKSAAGVDIIQGATALDTLKFVSRDGNGNVIAGYNFADLKFEKYGDDLVIIAPDKSGTIIADFFTAESKVDIIKTADRLDAHSIKSDAVLNIVLDEEDNLFEKKSDLAGYKLNVILDEENSTGYVSGLEADDNITLAGGELSRFWDGTIMNNALTITDGTNSISVTDYFAAETYPAFKLNTQALPTALDVNLYDTENAYEFTSFVESVHGVGKVAADKLAINGVDKIVTGEEKVLYTRTDNGNLVVWSGNGAIQTDKITVTGFNFAKPTQEAPATDILVNDGTTENMTLDVTLTGSDYVSATGYAERIVTNYDSSVQFSTDFTGTDTLVFNAKADKIKYSRVGNDLVITNCVNDEPVKTTVLGYYTSGDMSVAGQYPTVVVDLAGTENDTTLGALTITDISGVSDIIGTDLGETIELTATQSIIPQREDNEFPNYDSQTGEYTSNVGHGKIKIDAYAAGMKGNDIISGTDGNDWINGGDGDDTIYGGTKGKDMLAGGDGENYIVAGDSVANQMVLNTDGVEIYGGKNKDTIYAGGNADTENYIWAHGGDDIITLYGGKNTIMLVEDDLSSSGNDTIIGSSSADILKFASNTGAGYVGFKESELEFAFSDDKKDVIITVTNGDTVTLEDYNYKSVDNVIVLNEEGTGYDTIKISDYVNVDDRLVVNAKKKTITGSSYDDAIIADNYESIRGLNKTVYGKDGDDLILAGAGNDKLYGGNGNDTFVFRLGDGKDVVYSETGDDYLEFRGFSAGSVALEESGKDLILYYGDDDKVTLKSFLNGTHSVQGYRVYDEDGALVEDQTLLGTNTPIIEIDMTETNKTTLKGSVISESIVGSAKNNTIKGGGGNDVIDAFAGKNKVYAESRAGDKVTVYSGLGNDTLNAGVGKDKFIFNKNHGNDTVVINSKAVKGQTVTTLDFSKAGTLSFSESGNNLIITNTFKRESGADVSETTTIKNYLKGNYSDFVNIIDNSGDEYNLYNYLKEMQDDDMSTLVVGNVKATKNQKITGSYLDETLAGGLKNDTIKSNGGIDYIYGNKGNDKLYGYIASTKTKVGKKTVTTNYYSNDVVDPATGKTTTLASDNAKTFVFDCDYKGGFIGGDGKDSIYNAKNADNIQFIVSSDDDSVSVNSAVAKLLDNMTITKSKNNLVISYGYGTDKKGKTVVTDSVTISNYYKLDSESEAVRYIDIVSEEDSGYQRVLGTIDLAEDIQNGKVVEDVAKNIAGSTVYTSPMMSLEEVRFDNSDVFGNDRYVDMRMLGNPKTVIYDGHGDDTYFATMNHYLYINDTDGNDTLDLIIGETNKVNLFFDVAAENSEAVVSDSLFFVESDKITPTGATGSVEVANWFGEDGKASYMSVVANGKDYTVDMDKLADIRSEVAGWLADYSGTHAGMDTAAKVLNSGDTAAIQEMLQLYNA